MKPKLKYAGLLPVAVFCIAVSSCTEEGIPEEGVAAEIRLGSGIELQSKASFTAADTQVRAGEQVYVWIDRNVNDLPLLYGQVMTADGSGNLSGETKMYFPMNGDNINIYSLHTNADLPSDTYPDGEFVHEVKAEQKTIEDYVYSDLLYAKSGDVAKTTDRIALKYFHQLSKIEMAIATKDGLTGDEITGISIGGIRRFANVTADKASLADYLSVEPAGEVSSIAISQDISEDFTEGKAVYNDAIIVPQSVEAGTEFINVTLQDGRTVAYRLTSPIEFKSGMKYVLQMTIGFSDIELTTTVSDWIDAGGPIVAVSDTVKFTVSYTDGTSEQTRTIDTDTIRFNGSGKTVRSISLPDYGTSYLIGRSDITSIVLNFNDEGVLEFRPAIEGYIPIGSYAEMQLINSLDTKDGRYRQEGDIDLLNEPWMPIDNFEGEYDGNGFEFSNIIIDLDNAAGGSGIFGRVDRALLSNIHLVSGVVEVKIYSGGAICGSATKSTIEYCTNKAEIQGGGSNRTIGGIVGSATGCIVSSCTNSGSILYSSEAGGIVGSTTSSTIEYCENTGKVLAKSSSSSSSAGGITATFERSVINNCSNSGEISYNSGSNFQGGGIVGFSQSGSINSSYNTGTLTVPAGNEVDCGGIAGRSASAITACYNTGIIYSLGGSSIFFSYTGGIVGYLIGGSVSASYNTGYIKSNTITMKAGGVVGIDSAGYTSIITACYWKEDAGVTSAFGSENDESTVTDVLPFSDTFTPDPDKYPEWGTGNGETFGWWKNYTGNDGLPQLWWE